MKILQHILIIICLSSLLLICESCHIKHHGADQGVTIQERQITIPTYLTGEPEINPIFYTPANYQGAQRHVYPYPNIDKLTDEKLDKTYKGLFLENEYLKLCVLPELGGRLYIATDKTNGYDFIYHNRVIKPSLIGMAGAWISGGIEWNIPHHHRVSTFMPVDYKLKNNPDGSKTIWVGEYEKRHHTKWEVGLTLYPGKAFVKTDVRLFNVTPVVKSFLIWANPAVHANENYQVIFPPDVEKAVYHAKVEFTDWPVSKQYYRGIDFTEGVDISWWKNTRSPTSFFAWGTEKDFLAGIDHGKNAGIVFIGDHHIFRGKKMWNWGNNDVARMWDQMLTDEDGPYMELMMGAYSDNQPDYSWNNPYSTKFGTFYFYPVKGLSGIKEAGRDLAVNLELTGSKAIIQLYTSSPNSGLKIALTGRDEVLSETIVNVDPENPVIFECSLNDAVQPEDLKIVILDSGGKELLSYTPPVKKNLPHPPVYKNPPEPELIASVEDLYLAGLRLDQFGNPDLDPMKYWQEALRRDPHNIWVNTEIGIKMLEKYNYSEAESYLRKVTDKVSGNYTSPRYGEATYYLGLSLMQQGKYKEAYDILYNATWNAEWTSPAYFLLARLASYDGELKTALAHLDRAIAANAFNLEALQLRAIIRRHLGKNRDASGQIEGLLKTDPLNFIGIAERYFLNNKPAGAEHRLIERLRNEPDNYLETASRYADAGMYDDAIAIMSLATNSNESRLNTNPMIWYYLGYYHNLSGDKQKSLESYHRACDLPIDYCFPHGSSSEKVLLNTIMELPDEANTYYFLGNLYCDFQPRLALELWKKAIELNNQVQVFFRNAAFVEANYLNEMDIAIKDIKRAVELNPDDPLYIEELDRYLAYAGVSPEERLMIMEEHHQTLPGSDAAMARYISLLNLNSRLEEAIGILNNRHFHSAEASDINLHVQWTDAYLLRGLKFMENKEYDKAIADFTTAMKFPRNLESARDGKIAIALYYRGLAEEKLGNKDRAGEDFIHLVNFESIEGWGTGRWPEVDYCKALALKKLGRQNEALHIFAELIQKGKEMAVYQPHSATNLSSVKVRYRINQTRAEGYYYQSLGNLGLGNKATAEQQMKKSLKMDPAQIGAGKYFEFALYVPQ